jgi:hypothetical protein
MQTPTQFPTWATTADGQAVFVPDQFSFNQAVKPVAAGGLGATWGAATPAVTRSLGGGDGCNNSAEPQCRANRHPAAPGIWARYRVENDVIRTGARIVATLEGGGRDD